jgi:hypothetical protein
VKAAGGAGVRNCVSNIQITHDTLGAVTEVALRDGAAGTVLWRSEVADRRERGIDLQPHPGDLRDREHL